MNRRLRKSTAIIAALFVAALAIASFLHGNHSHDKDHSCFICSFHKLARTAVVSKVVFTDCLVVVGLTLLPCVARLDAGDAFVHRARAPPYF